MPRLNTSVQNHWNRLKRSNGLSAEITSLDPSWENRNATIVLARVDSQAVTNREVTYEADAQDILVDVYEYQGREPQVGDKFVYCRQITKALSETVTAEARPASDSEQCFRRWMGDGVYRVHCKIIDRETR